MEKDFQVPLSVILSLFNLMRASFNPKTNSNLQLGILILLIKTQFQPCFDCVKPWTEIRQTLLNQSEIFSKSHSKNHINTEKPYSTVHHSGDIYNFRRCPQRIEKLIKQKLKKF